MILFPDYMTVYPLNKKKPNTASQWGLSNNCKIFFFYNSDSVAEKESAEEA